MPRSALVLAGGLGTRLRAVVSDRPKILAEVNGKPFIAYLLDRLEAAGVERVMLCTGHLAEQVEQVLGRSHGALALAYSQEREPLGTGGALRLAAAGLSDAAFLVLNGDSLATVDLAALARFHSAREAAASMALVQVSDAGRYGTVATAPDGRVTAFVEKGAAHGPGQVNAGVYVIRRDLLLAQAADRPVSLERETFPGWICRVGFFALRTPAALLDIGTPESYAQARAFLAGAGRTPVG